ncbi:methyltransferase domain-containing protein [Lysobacter sp. LF1]|uniref:Methyltransferase domain-containing protein n=1 Tax=Lysobacter stagni TaxID=3045172 RepID=A0ABT6XF21_9GAMM|nr:methyltransferase domain-containing protein [Lysobacter sp. LF1]MDI9238740.1 methyltransferase domain-containing protein [Lysobacter sp. LF1]
MSITDWLLEPEVAGCPVDGLARFEAHRSVLRRKQMIRSVFDEFHQVFTDLDRKHLDSEGLLVELGAGVYPVRETVPEVLATDVVAAPHLDKVIDAGAMDFPNESVHAFYLQNVFHHFPDPDRFFAELERTLAPGGGAILIEPASGPVASWLYPRLFATEGYDKTASDWRTPVGGPMSGANQALSYLVFDRDRARFEASHPALEIVHRDALPNWPRYLVSGGLNFRPLLPSFMTLPLRWMESVLSPLRSLLGLHRVIVLRKRNQS